MKPGSVLSSARLRTILCILASICAYSISVAISVGPSTNVLWHDNISYHMPNFIYVLDSLRYGFGLPAWDPALGGSPVHITSLSLFPYVPYRLAAYVAGLVTGMQELGAYKVSLVMGAALAALGWWLFLHDWLGSRAGATLGTLVFLFGGTGITLFHQEQALVTVLPMPWVLLFMRMLSRDARYLYLVSALIGFSFTLHYPHIQLLSLVFFLIAIAVTGGLRVSTVKKVFMDRQRLLLSLGLFVLAASPLMPIMTSMGDFMSPLRGGEELGAGMLGQYVELNSVQKSSAEFSYLLNYLIPVRSERLVIDLYALFIPYTGLALAAAALALRFREARPALIVAFFGLWAALGIHAYMPQALFMIKFPFIGGFRQWYHFVPVVNLAVSALSALGAVVLIEKWRLTAGTRTIAVGVALVCGAVVAEGGIYMDQYSSSALAHTMRGPGHIGRQEFLSYLSDGTFAGNLHGRNLGVVRDFRPMIMYRSQMRLIKTCPSVMESGVFLTANVYSEPALGTRSRQPDIMEQFCAMGLQASSVIARLPKGVRTGPGIVIQNIAENSDGSGSFEMPAGEYAMNSKIPLSGFEVTPRAVRISGIAPRDGMLVVPFAHGLGFEARLFGQKVRTFSVYKGAMTGIMVTEGPFELDLAIAVSLYKIAVLLQYISIAAGAAFIWLKRPGSM